MITNKQVYEVYQSIEFSIRTPLNERAEIVYSVLEKQCLSQFKEWDYIKKSTDRKKVKDTERIHKVKRVLEDRNLNWVVKLKVGKISVLLNW